MRDNSFDRTTERNCVQKRRFLIAEYEEVKAGPSPRSRDATNCLLEALSLSSAQVSRLRQEISENTQSFAIEHA
jgi:hypothetical protein